jgi:hypothetical protein
VIDAWVHTYNHARPHQSRDMATPASLFRPSRNGQDRQQHHPEPAPERRLDEPDRLPSQAVAAATLVPQSANAVEFDTVIAASGVLNVLPRAQRIKMGPAFADRPAHVWVDEHSVHVLINSSPVKTVPSNLNAADLAELQLRGAQPAGPPPASPAPPRGGQLAAGAAIEVDRAVDTDGTIQLAGNKLNVGTPLAGRRVTLRLDGHLLHVIADGTLAKTLPAPIATHQRTTLRGARLAAASLPPPAAGPISVQRRVPKQGVVMVTRQRLHIGPTHAGKTVTILVEDTPLPRPTRRPATRPASPHHQPARHPIQGLRRTRQRLTHVKEVPRTRRQRSPETSHNRLNLGKSVSADRGRNFGLDPEGVDHGPSLGVAGGGEGPHRAGGAGR